MLYPSALYEAQGDPLAVYQALDTVLHDVFCDMLGFAGIEMHRRILGLAHNADFETIEDAARRAKCEQAALAFGRHLAVNRRRIASIEEANRVAAYLERKGWP